MFIDKIPVRLRLSMGHALWMALIFAVTGYAIYRVVERNLLQSVDGALLASAQAVRDAKLMQGVATPNFEQLLSEFFGERYINAYAQIVDLSGKVRQKSDAAMSADLRLPMTPQALKRAEGGIETFETFLRGQRQSPVRQLTLPVLFQGRFTGDIVQVAAPLDSTYAAMNQISFVLWIVIPTATFLSAIFGYILARRSLTPVREMQLAVSELSGDDLSTRLSVPPARDEIQGLAKTFNGMLERLDDAFARLRRFSADVSHELRTPLAVLRGEAELALRRERSADEYKTALQTIAREAKEMGMTIEDLLLLAKAESQSVIMQWNEVGTESFIDMLVSSVESIYQNKNVTLNVINTAPETFRGSQNYLSIALKNILLNAAKHTPQGSSVTFKVAKEKNDLVFSVKDQGEGIPEHALPYIFDPFYRADTARNRSAGGFGIGLSLAKAMARLHAGQITVESKAGQGAEFFVRFPYRTGNA